MPAQRQIILVINPNSSRSATDAIDRALEDFRFADGPLIDVRQIDEGPPGVETDAHVHQVVAPMIEFVETRDPKPDAIVVACFSDPGVHAIREVFDGPVLGIAECAALHALTRARTFGVISILPAGVKRHWRFFAAMGIEHKVAGDIAIGLGVTELTDETTVNARLRDVGARLRDDHGAEAIILGCTGFADYRAGLERDIGLPVIDPNQAAIGAAITVLQSGRPGE